MRKKILVAVLIWLFVFENIVFSQNSLVKQWDKRFGGAVEERLHLVKQTLDSGYILAGRAYSGISGDKTQSNWDTTNVTADYWVVKIDSLGIKQWDKRYGGTANDWSNSLQLTNDGGYILGGWSFSDIGGDKTQPSWGIYDYWIIKFDSLGNKQWDKRFGGVDPDGLFAIELTNDGGYLLGGHSWSGISGDKTQPNWNTFNATPDYWIVKIDSIGNKQWDKRYGGTNYDYLRSIQKTSDGGYILGGYSNSGIGGDKTQPCWDSLHVRGDYWIVKIDSLGNKQWDKRFGGVYDETLYSMQQTIDGGYILGGNSYSEIDGDKTQPLWGGLGDVDYWIVKTDSLGNKQWDKDFGGTNLEEKFGNISQTSDGGYLIPGMSYSDLSGDKTEDNLGQAQTWVVKTDSSGIKQWDKTVFTTGLDEQGLAIQISDRCYLFANYTYAGIGGYKTQPNWGATFTNDLWVIKFCDTILTTTIPSTISNQQSAIIFSPNPTTNEINISNLIFNVGDKISVLDPLGKTIFTKVFSALAANCKLSTAGLSNGMYFLRVETMSHGERTRTIVKKVVVQH